MARVSEHRVTGGAGQARAHAANGYSPGSHGYDHEHEEVG